MSPGADQGHRMTGDIFELVLLCLLGQIRRRSETWRYASIAFKGVCVCALEIGNSPKESFSDFSVAFSLI